MSYKFDSLITILNRLDRREHITVKTLADELEVGERTIYRYLDTLLTAGFPINFDKKQGTYLFDEGYALRKPDLGLEETLAFALAKRFLGNFGPGMEKILGAMESKLAIKNTDVPRDIILAPEEQPAKVSDFLVAIHRAVIDYQRIMLIYKALSTDELTERKVDPYYLFFQDGYWHVRAYCHLRREFRTFALDKIISLRSLDEYFVPEEISRDDDLSGSFSAFVDGKPVRVTLVFDREVAQYILRRRWHKSQEVKKLKGGGIEVRFLVNGILGIKPWIYRWLPHVRVVEPRELKEIMGRELQRALEDHLPPELTRV